MLIIITTGFNSIVEYVLKALEHTFKKNNIMYRIISSKKHSHTIKDDDVLLLFSGSWFNKESYIKNKKIIYNTEPLFLKKGPYDIIDNIKDGQLLLEFSKRNFEILDNNKLNYIYVPFGYSPAYEKNLGNVNTCDKDIDIFFYGATSKRRTNILDNLINLKKYNILYGKYYSEDRDNIIKKSKIILVINNHNDINTHTNDLFRLSYLMANKVFVIVEETLDIDVDNKLKSFGVVICKYDELINESLYWLTQSESKRRNICENIYEMFKKEYNYDDLLPVKEIKNLI